MSRPAKNRVVSSLPTFTGFKPEGEKGTSGEKIVMSIEEFEAVRLIDFEGLTQDQCAEKMIVSRTTVQRIYKSARAKLAKMLVNGACLKIEGGSFCLKN